ncbi:MAG TPA: hypothetical protein VGJ49_00285 [Gaiellaceae bacterium]|jgi:hypothetical protein
MRTVEHAVDVWDLTGMDPRLDSRLLHDHLRSFAAEGWELVWMGVNVDLADHHRGPCHVLVLKRITETP